MRLKSRELIMKLMQDQEDCSAKFEEWLSGSDQTFAGLWACAGFGKSWTVKHLVDEVILRNSNYSPILTSMTHSAVDVLIEFTGMAVMTLHAFMGWVPYVDKETGEEGLSTPKMRDANAPNRTTSEMLIVVDEAGLMGHTEIALLIEECIETGARVLFVGDHKQCFPVIKDGERLCIPAYEATECYLELTIPKRVDDGNVIYALSKAYRNTVDGARQPKLRTILNKDKKTGIRHVDDIEEIAYKAFTAGIRDNNIRDIKVLAFTNARCLTLNRKIRKKVMGLKDPTPIVGEEMVANTSIENSTHDAVIIRNNQIVTVLEVEKTVQSGLEGAFILYADKDGEPIEETVFVPASPAKFANRLKELARLAKDYAKNGKVDESKLSWRAFYALKEAVSDIRYTYAMTINKCQGRTLHHALIDMNDIAICQNREQAARLAYTAVTRATTYVTIEGELNATYNDSHK